MKTKARKIYAAVDTAHDITTRLCAAEQHRRAGEIAKAIGEVDAALNIATSIEDEERIAECQLELGNLHRYVPNALEAILQLNAAEAYYRRVGHPRLARVLTRQGMILGDMGEHTRALDHYRESLTLIEALGKDSDPREEATSLGAIGVACTQLDDFEQAEAAYRRSIPLFQLAGALESITFIYNNLAILRVRTLERLTARDVSSTLIAQQAFEFIDLGFSQNVEVQSPMARAALFNTRGDLLAALGRLDESLAEIAQSLAIYRAMRLPRGEADALTNMGEALLKLGRAEQALTHLQAAERIVSTHALKDHERALQQLFADVYENLGDSAKALAHFKKYHQLDAENQRRDTHKKLQQLAMREEIENALAEATRQRERSAKLAAQNQTLDRIAHEDALTGVANRRRLDEWALEQPAALPGGIAVALLDIDHFKRINDNYSHATGDLVLREMGAVLRAQARGSDLVARYGGEEFVVVMHGVTEAHVHDFMERLRAAVESHEWTRIGPQLAVTTSIGVAQADGRLAFKALLEAADTALYAAKHAGRNRVMLALSTSNGSEAKIP